MLLLQRAQHPSVSQGIPWEKEVGNMSGEEKSS